MTRVMHIRRLRENDIMAVLFLARMHHASSRYKHLPFAGERAWKLCNAFLTLPQYCGFVIADDTDTPVGYLGLETQPYAFCDLTIAHDILLYVHPDHRNMPNFRGLVDAAVKWCKTSDVHTLMLSVTSAPDDLMVHRQGKVYEAVGFKWQGEYFIKEIK